MRNEQKPALLLRDIGMHPRYKGYAYLLHILDVTNEQPELLYKMSSVVYPEIMKCIGIGGQIIQLGVGTDVSPVEMQTLIQRNAKICGSMGHAGSDIYPSVLRMMASGRIDMRKMVTGRFALNDIERAIDVSRQRELGHGKILVSQHY